MQNSYYNKFYLGVDHREQMITHTFISLVVPLNRSQHG